MIRTKDGYAKLWKLNNPGNDNKILLAGGGEVEKSTTSSANSIVQRNNLGLIISDLTDKAPFTVASNKLVANLNANYLDGTSKGGLLTDFSTTDSEGKLSITVGGTTLSTTPKHLAYLENISNKTYTTVKQIKDRIVTLFSGIGGGIGANVVVPANAVINWDSENTTVTDSSVYTFTKLSGGYAGTTYGQWLITGYHNNTIGYVGRNNNTWGSINWLATKQDLESKLNTSGGVVDYLKIKTGLNTSGLFPNTNISLGGEDTTLWLYTLEALHIYGKTIDFRTQPTVNGNTIWTSANDGANSGLDADTLDGFQASAFMNFTKGTTYVGASMGSGELSKLVGGEGYIEFWDTTGGWFNSKWGKVTANDGFVGNLTGNVTGKADSSEVSSKVGGSSIYIYPMGGNEINFGGNFTADKTIHIGFRTIDERPIPDTYKFSQGTADLIARGFIKNNSSDSYVLLGGGGHKALTSFYQTGDLSFGLDNLVTSVLADGNCTLQDGAILVSGNADTYFRLNLSEGIDSSIPYSISFFIENFTGSAPWNWAIGDNNNASNFTLVVNSNGWAHATGLFPSRFLGSTRIIIDDTARNGNSVIKISKITLVKGNIPSYNSVRNYLPISGGTLTGALKVEGDITTTGKLNYTTTELNNWNVAKGEGAIRLISVGTTANSNAPNYFCSGISVMTKYTGFQLAAYGGKENKLYFRSVIDTGVWQDWKTLADETYVDTLVKTRLSTSGGTVKGDLIIVRNPSVIQFKPNDSTTNGFLGVDSDGPIWYASDAKTKYKIWNENNLTPSNYLLKTGGTIIAPLTIDTELDRSLIFDEPTGEKHHVISFKASGTEYGYLKASALSGTNNLSYNDNIILHAANYSTYALPKAGGTLDGTITIKPTNTSGFLDGLILYDPGQGSGESLKIVWKSTSYTTGHWLGVEPSGGGVLKFNDNKVWHAGNFTPGDYLAKSGGTVTGRLGIDNYLQFKSNQSKEYLLGTPSEGNLSYYDGTAWRTIYHTGNDGSGSGLDADTVDGKQVTLGDNKPWGTIPAITNAGHMDVGKHFEFHFDNTTGSDYSTALMCTGNYSNIVNLPSTTGTLALTTDTVANATKFDNYSSSAFMIYTLNDSYVDATFVSETLSKKAKDKYIEYYDSKGGGWYNSYWGKVKAVDGFIGNLTGNADTATNATSADILSKTWEDDADYGRGTGVRIIKAPGNAAGKFPQAYCAGLSVMSSYVGWQLASYGGGDLNPWFRSYQDTNKWKPWRKLAFIDDTVAAANKIGTYTVDNIYVKQRDFVGGKNILSTSLGGGGCTTATSGRDGTITWNVTVGKDAYFYIYTKEAIKEGEKLVLSFDVSGVNASNFASQWCWQNVDTRGKVIIRGNGRVYMYVVNSAAVGADGLILIDDWTSIGNVSGQSGPITFSNFKLERGEMGSDFSFNPIYVALKTDKAPDSDKLDGVDGASYARRAAANDFVINGNEITMVPSSYSGELWLNHKTTTGTNGNITKYNFGNGKGGTTGVTLQADSFTGNANTATTATYAKSLVTNDNKSMVHFTSSTLYVGDTIYTNYNTNILGKSIKLRYGTSATDGLILAENGRVGIGVASPSVKLEVDGSIKANTNISATDAYFSGNCFLKAGQEGIYVHGSGISWHNSSNAWTKSIVNITSEGKVGIGVSPEKDFHVGGDFKASGQSYFGTSTGCDLHLLRTNGYNYITAYKSLMLCVDGGSNNYALSLDSTTKNATFYGNVTAPSFIKSGSSDDYVLLGGGGHTKIHGLVEYGLENLAFGFGSGGQTSVANNIVTFTGGNSDTYFYISLTQTIDYTIPYTVGVYVENWSGTGSWSFGVGLLDNGNFALTITKNGWNWGTGYFMSGLNGASSFILDDTYRPTPAPTMKISKAVVVKGTSRAHYTPPLSKLSYYLPIGGGTLTGDLKLDTCLIFNNTNLSNWNVSRMTGALRIMHIGNSSTGNAPSAYCSGLSVMSKYTGFLLASYGGESNAFYFRSVSDGDKWLSWREVAFKDYVSSSYLPLIGGTLANTGTVLTIKLKDSTKIPYINFRLNDTDLGDLGVNSSKNLVYYSGGWKKIWHEGNLTPGNYLPASSYTASDVLTKLKTVDGSGSGLDADTVDGYHANSFVYSTGTYNLKPNAGCYRPRTTYIAIRLSNVNSVWTMMCMELLIREHYSNPNYGKVILLVDKNNANALSGGLYYVLGKLSSSFKIYAAWDGTYFTVYLAGSWAYDSMTVQEVLFGDTAAETYSKSISVTGVNSLPSSYVTLTMKNYYTVVGSAGTDPNTIYYVT